LGPAWAPAKVAPRPGSRPPCCWPPEEEGALKNSEPSTPPERGPPTEGRVGTAVVAIVVEGDGVVDVAIK